MDRPLLVVVGGPNGVGKTTVAESLAANRNLEYLGADAIAAQLAPATPEKAALSAGKEFLSRVRDRLDAKQSFIVESTLAGLSLRKSLEIARAKGYVVSIVFVFVDSVDICIARVAERVRKGGHDVPVEDIVRRFRRSNDNFWWRYRPFASDWLLLYNGNAGIAHIASGSAEQVEVSDPKRYLQFQQLVI